MFLHLSVILFTGGGGGVLPSHNAMGRQTTLPQADSPPPPPPPGKLRDTVNKRAVPILPKCILVYHTSTLLFSRKSMMIYCMETNWLKAGINAFFDNLVFISWNIFILFCLGNNGWWSIQLIRSWPMYCQNRYLLVLTHNQVKFFNFSLHKNLVEHLNAEIVLETISDVSVALEWIRSTFLYIRVMKNPKHYGQ